MPKPSDLTYKINIALSSKKLPSLLIELLLVFTVCLSVLSSFTVSADSIDIPEFTQGSLGKHTQYFREVDGKMSLESALTAFQSDSLFHGSTNSISLGIDVAPVWMRFTINNRSTQTLNYRLSVETPWIDYIDTWLIQDGEMVRHIIGGDAYPFESRPMQYRFYAFEHEFLAGKTEVIMRVETKGPMALPVQFSSVEQAIHRDIASGYQYGALYGIMLALALYNLVLFGFIRQREYGLYGLYLLGFVLNSLSYTGQLHTIITYDFGAYFQDWLDIFLMITYSVAGLHFARALLHTKDYAPKLDRFVLRTTLYIPLGMLVGFVFNHLFFSMILAFVLNTCFVMLFIAMGVKALQAQKPFAVIFILSSVTAAVCITISTLAVAGVLVPYNDYTFKAIEVGMAFEAILLASILARQFRMAQIDKLIAEKYACTDPLTELNNRRGFKEFTESKWQEIVEAQHNVSIALIDIDYFKQVNDTHGHNIGDEVLKLVAKAIADSCRDGDIAARWGGEEFIVLLPNTSRDGAIMQAEHIREAIESISFDTLNGELTLTASIGVAGTVAGKFELSSIHQGTLEALIKNADRALYIAKQDGKNQVRIVS
ncbi:sensor domain-containing diguanylate cyclase [Shewanella olleyana]|uniref:sensor domain-containing diguanylate cyclase n=1 Tax=Shewanella olleyana TaxID=135626 RepID=UPI0020107F1B|nr:diguanylate cyclase [Shewanella olleyana]MCL1067828.1 sensor domain-containing diguanylate cyclase [Shewanella olleyana]